MVNTYLYKLHNFYCVLISGGKSGVFEIEDLVDLLKRENSKDVFVATVPKEINYVEYICVVSARSKRHIKALAEFVRKVYKKKCHKSDYIPRIEGKDSEEWIALDLGTLQYLQYTRDAVITTKTDADLLAQMLIALISGIKQVLEDSMTPRRANS